MTMGTVGSYILVAHKGNGLRGLRLEAGAVVRADPPNQPYPGKQARAELKQKGREGRRFRRLHGANGDVRLGTKSLLCGGGPRI